jgi:nitrous oxide reductase
MIMGEGDPMRKDQQEQTKPRGGRRDFLRLAGLGGVAAGAAALAGGAPEAAAAEAGAAGPRRGGTGYRETEHVRRYYELARF